MRIVAVSKSVFWLAVGLCAGGLAVYYFFFNPASALNGKACLKDYPLTSQSLDCAGYDDSASRLKVVDAVIDTATELYIKEGKATAISVWVRDLENRQTASNNETQRYDPASLLKLPLMIAYYKVAEVDPAILEAKLPYVRDMSTINNSMQDFAPQGTLVLGQSYTVEELIDDMIINSDNNAAAILIKHLSPSIFSDTLLDLGIKIPSSDNTELHDFLTAKSYANIFRSLYNSSYLTREYSQKTLNLLSKIKFEGITRLLPEGVVVAHKFGEREVNNPDGSVQFRELHDCGIVYKKDEPYSLCIMTRGKDFSELETILENISQTVYEKI